MGYHIILRCTAIIKPEFIECIQFDYFNYHKFRFIEDDTAVATIPEKYKELFLKWQELYIVEETGGSFYEFEMEGDRFTFEISKRPYLHRSRNHRTTLEDDYKRMMLYIIAPISSTILNCVIEHDDFDDKITTYTDEEVRRFHPDR